MSDTNKPDPQVKIDGQIDSVHIGDAEHHHYTEGRRLTEPEIRELKQKVRRLADATKIDEVEYWAELKTILGKGLRELCLEQKAAAHKILDLMLECSDYAKELDSRPQSDQEQARAVAEMLVQNSELAAKLTNLQRTHDELKKQRQQQHSQSQQLQETNSKLSHQVDELTRSLKQAQSHRVSTHCISCSATSKELADAKGAQRVWIGLTLVMAVCTGAFGLLYKQARAETVAVGARIQNCEYNGQLYRLGSIIDNPHAPDIKCVQGDSGQVAFWQQLQAHSKRKQKLR
ncbi:hypothetical protein [Chromobacterium violaceum]|uniref:Uncharacterized protein n=1 Tax=Chromobacterium violaceum TaxID=536 RepID=A0AAX2MEZ6_CHRVL|nr:hypothetical protein [Chromobacterium violaceum]OLZ76967.1 hypothetical protein BS642_15175 [Chromobacterium violaceum]STB70174.1 Uncharacterised protein [Chromobacterium violaceum]SUX34818.1 Uncharacterised protein [Chromobacterium violaceum]